MIEELQRADPIVIGSPMHNFGIASQLKAWFDNVIRAGKTFRGEKGPEGLLKGKRAIVVETRSGVYTTGPAVAFNHQEPHLKTLLGLSALPTYESSTPRASTWDLKAGRMGSPTQRGS